MDKNNPQHHLGIVVMLGAIWGFSEAALGMGLRSCASFLSGSIMTGVALFFIAASWILTRRALSVALLIAVASLFKMFDALLLSLPLQHGAIGNPIFAFLMEGAAFLLLISVFLTKKVGHQALFGGMSALLAVNLFPLVKYVTGVPACVFPGTNYPLSLYYTPVAVALSGITVPLGFLAGNKIGALATNLRGSAWAWRLRNIASPVTLLLCLVIIALIRLS